MGPALELLLGEVIDGLLLHLCAAVAAAHDGCCLFEGESRKQSVVVACLGSRFFVCVGGVWLVVVQIMNRMDNSVLIWEVCGLERKTQIGVRDVTLFVPEQT